MQGGWSMKGIRKSSAFLTCIGTISAIFLLSYGCASLNNGEDRAITEPQDTGFAPPIYYDFGDVRLPEELKVDEKSSFVYRTSGFSSGLLVLEGRVELYSLITFFENSMSTDNWKFVSSFKSPRTLMLFQKESRWCVINITERNISTLVEIWVAPTAGESASGLMQ